MIVIILDHYNATHTHTTCTYPRAQLEWTLKFRLKLVEEVPKFTEVGAKQTLNYATFKLPLLGFWRYKYKIYYNLIH